MTPQRRKEQSYLSGTRLAWVKSWLESGGSLNASTIISKFGVCRRTASRDLKFLRKHFDLPLAYDSSLKAFFLPSPGIDRADDSMAGRYARILAEARPELTAAEWAAIRDINRLSRAPADTLPMRVATGDGLERWGIDQEELADKLRRLSFAGLCAVDEMTRVHHNRSEGR